LTINPNFVDTPYLVSEIYGLDINKCRTIETSVNAVIWFPPLRQSIYFTTHSQQEAQNHDVTNESMIEVQPGTSKCFESTASPRVRPRDIRPLAQLEKRQTDEQGTKRRSGSANVTTSLAKKKSLITILERNSARQKELQQESRNLHLKKYRHASTELKAYSTRHV
jgi:hypothetical protein